MISISFINNEPETLIASDPYVAFNCYIENASTDIEDSINNFNTLKSKLLFESEIDASSIDASDLYIEKESNNILTKIGTTIANLFKKIANMFTNVIAKFRRSGFENKSDVEKLQVACKKDPNLAQQLTDAWAEGKLNLQDLKNVEELEHAYEELVAMDKRMVDPNSFDAKYEEFKRKAKESDKSAAVTLANSAKILATSIVAVVGIRETAIKVQKASSDRVAVMTKFANHTASMNIPGASELANKTMGNLIGDGTIKNGKLSRHESIWNASKTLAGHENRVIQSTDKFFTRVGKIMNIAKNKNSDEDLKILRSARNSFNNK